MRSATRPRCGNCHKHVYLTEEEVIHAINMCLMHGARPLRWYKCPVDSTKFHMTGKPKNR